MVGQVKWKTLKFQVFIQYGTIKGNYYIMSAHLKL